MYVAESVKRMSPAFVPRMNWFPWIRCPLLCFGKLNESPLHDTAPAVIVSCVAESTEMTRQ